MSRFKTKHQAQNMRNHSWACRDCGSMYKQKKTKCDYCPGEIHYFPSQAELRRFGQLRLMEKAGQIHGLELQPKYSICVNKTHVAWYKADFQYFDKNNFMTVEDVKGTLNDKYLDPVFKLKKKLVEAIYGIEIKIVKA